MVDELASSIMGDLESHGDSEKAKMVAQYMKTSKLIFLGVSVTQARRITRKHIKGISLDVMVSLMEILWVKPVFDFKLAAIEIMESYSAKGGLDTALEMIDRWIEDVDTWSVVDPLCVVCLGNLIIRDHSVWDRISEWRESDNFWRRRASVLPGVELSKKRSHKPEYNDMILESLEPHLEDSEFFVSKAVGWVLRELSKREPELVRSYIEENRHRMTKLSIREGSKKL